MDGQTEENQIRLVLVDDQALFRASLSRFLATQPGVEIAGECGSSSEALQVLNGSSVDVVLWDFDLGRERRAEFIPAARRAGYKGHFLIIAGAVDARELAATLKLGASGIFLKSEGPDRLVQAIRLVASGAVWFDQKVIQLLADQLIDRPQLGDQRSGSLLTEREEKVLLGIVGGLTSRKIGDNIGISEGAVNAVVQQLFLKAGVRTRSRLVRVAIEARWVPLATWRNGREMQLPTVKPPGSHGPPTANRL